MTVTLARVYDEPNADRVLVDRLWPRGFRKDDPRIGRWLKEAAPSKELRTWYHEDKPARFDEFASRYREELSDGPAADALAELIALADAGDVELASAVKDVDDSHLPVLADAIADPPTAPADS